MPQHPLDPAVARLLAERRRAVGLSQVGLALATGLRAGSIANYETMRCGIPNDKRTLIERALTEAETRALHPE